MKWLIVFAAMGCTKSGTDSGTDQGPGPHDNSNVDGGPPVPCESEMGALSGQVIRALDWEEEERPAANAHVFASMQGSTEQAISIFADSEGEYTASLPDGGYEVYALSNDNCIFFLEAVFGILVLEVRLLKIDPKFTRSGPLVPF